MDTPETEAQSALVQLVSSELEREPPAAAKILAEAIRKQRPGVASILFYGSCLRKETDEGVFDFYVLVDRYRETYDSLLLAAGNAVLPPNVFYIEAPGPNGTLRAKYAVLSIRDFEKAVSPGCVHPYIWARFSQPALCIYAKDVESKHAAARCGAQAIVTLVKRLGVFLPMRGGRQKFSMSALWQEAFRHTYGAERRPEAEESIQAIYEAARERYDEAAIHSLTILEEEGWYDSVAVRGEGGAVEIAMSPWRRLWMMWRWHLSRPIARTLAILRLIKTAFTFGDWVPYATWKLERHTGEPVELSERQRKHPLIFAWPVIWRVYLRRRPE